MKVTKNILLSTARRKNRMFWCTYGKLLQECS